MTSFDEAGTKEDIKGLVMFTARDAEVIEAEKTELASLANKSIFNRYRWYFSKSGPGWMQSAMTLGSGTAMASLYAGAFMQYKLLWVQPLAMVVGMVMLWAMSYQTLSTGMKPFQAMKQYVHPALAWSWAIASLLATIIWHLPQYALAAGMGDDMIKAVTGIKPSDGQQMAILIGLGLLFLVISTAITWKYSSGNKGIRIYEKALKILVWMVVICFGVVVIRQSLAGKIEWIKVLKGFLQFEVPRDARGVSIVMAAFGAAVGINMTFLFPYTLLARGWGKEHKGLSRFDLVTGMLLPYCIATSLMVIATGCTIYDPQTFGNTGTLLSPIKAASMLEATGMSVFFSRIIFGFGILGMALSTITLHMLVSGFIACELFGIEPNGWRYKLACLIPAPAIAGVVLWQYIGPWIAIHTSAICGLMLPIAYIGFFILQNSERYLKEDKPRGVKRFIWNAAMLVSIFVSLGSVCYYLYSNYIN